MMKTRILLCAGLLTMGTAITLDSTGVMARGLTQREHRSAPKNAIALEKNAEYYHRSGKVKLERGDYQGAIADCTRAIKINPNFDKAYYNRGVAKYNLGDYSAAIADYNKSIEILPNVPEAYYGRGHAKHNLGDYSAAIADYNKSIALKPNYADAYNNRGVAKGRLGDYSTAIADYNLALKINPNHPDALYNLANAEAGLRRDRVQDTVDHINRVRNAQTCCR